MEPKSVYYDREYHCPLCAELFKSLNIRSNAVYVVKKEADFHIVYKGLNPFYYSIVVCPSCYYAASQGVFGQEIPESLAGQLKFALDKLRPELSFDPCGERDRAAALECFILAVRTAQLKKVPAGELAGLLHGAAWISREMDHKESELVYLKEALKYYMEAYNRAPDAVAHMNEAQATYLIGELYRRTGDFARAIQWFRFALDTESIKEQPQLEKQIREQWSLAREENQKLKG